MKGQFGFLSGLFHKHIQEVVVNHRQRVFRHFENGREIASWPSSIALWQALDV
jgi:hypothetical protein